MDEEGRSVIVCDIGSQFVKYGLAEDYSPIYKFPAIVGRPKNEAQIGEKINDLEIKDLVAGNDALQLSSFLNVSRPVKNGIIENWDEMIALWELIFSSEKIKMSPQRAKLFLTESPLNTMQHREKTAEILFEKFNFHSIGIGNQAALTLFGQGLTSGVVVDFHDVVTDICPVNFYPINNLTKRIPSMENTKLSETIFDIVQTADAKARVELFKRIFLLGDSNVEATTVENEIKQLYLQKVLLNDSEKLKKTKIRVDKFPSDNDKSFIGGTVLARVNKDKPEFWISHESYKENGVNALG